MMIRDNGQGNRRDPRWYKWRQESRFVYRLGEDSWSTLVGQRQYLKYRKLGEDLPSLEGGPSWIVIYYKYRWATLRSVPSRWHLTTPTYLFSPVYPKIITPLFVSNSISDCLSASNLFPLQLPSLSLDSAPIFLFWEHSSYSSTQTRILVIISLLSFFLSEDGCVNTLLWRLILFVES